MQAQVDGINLSYEVTGDGPRTIVFAHSLGMDRTIWDAQVRHFKNRYRVLTFDGRGHGASDKPPAPYSVERFGEDLYGVLKAAGVERAVLVGLSMGGMASQACAIAHPEVVEALVLADTTCHYPGAQADWEARANAAEEKGLLSLVDFQMQRWLSDRTRAEQQDLLDHLKQVFLANDVAGYGAACRALGAMDLRGRVESIRCPTLIIVGEEDYATPPAMAEDLKQRIQGSEMVMLPGVRHLSAVEAPDAVNQHIERFLAKLPN
jgi:3-oxoadipate enol-lactonase